MKQLDILHFNNNEVRKVIDSNGEPWFVAKDICKGLLLNNVSEALSKLDSDEKSDIILTDTAGRPNKFVIVNESGMYGLIMSSRKKEAHDFKKWIRQEVLPSIRKTGSYTLTSTILDTTPELPSPRAQAITVIKECLELTSLFNIPEHISQLEAVKQAQDETGYDATPMLKLAPAQQKIAKEDIMLEPTALSKHFGLSPITMNKYLKELGLQHKVLGNWHPIGEGIKMAAINHWKNNYVSKDGYNYRWNLTMLKEFIANM